METTTAISNNDHNIISSLVLNGDLSKLQPAQKVQYYNGYCARLGLDPFTKPFELLSLSGKQVLYLTRSGAQQLNKLHKVSHAITSRELISEAGIYQVTARAESDGRFTESIGAVSIFYPDFMKQWDQNQNKMVNIKHPKAGQQLQGEDFANAIMKAETKAKRRATLDLLGLGILDETETETIPQAQKVSIESESIEAKVVNDEDEVKILHDEYLIIWNEFKDLQGTEIATPYHPSRWAKKGVINYKAAIKSLTEKLETLKQTA